jgi:hypothetical protein
VTGENDPTKGNGKHRSGTCTVEEVVKGPVKKG